MTFSFAQLASICELASHVTCVLTHLCKLSSAVSPWRAAWVLARARDVGGKPCNCCARRPDVQLVTCDMFLKLTAKSKAKSFRTLRKLGHAAIQLSLPLGSADNAGPAKRCCQCGPSGLWEGRCDWGDEKGRRRWVAPSGTCSEGQERHVATTRVASQRLQGVFLRSASIANCQRQGWSWQSCLAFSQGLRQVSMAMEQMGHNSRGHPAGCNGIRCDKDQPHAKRTNGFRNKKCI